MNFEILDNSYITSIDKILKYKINSTHLGCFQKVFFSQEQVECFKSYILTQALCINFCSLMGVKFLSYLRIFYSLINTVYRVFTKVNILTTVNNLK